jgi:hypothetical protein
MPVSQHKTSKLGSLLIFIPIQFPGETFRHGATSSLGRIEHADWNHRASGGVFAFQDPFRHEARFNPPSAEEGAKGMAKHGP